MFKKGMLSLIIWVMTFQFVGYLMGAMTETSITTWYTSLVQPPLNPPRIIFPIVWTILYVMIAVAGWQLWQHRVDKKANLAFKFYALQVIMNWLWTPVFFHLHLIQVGFYLIAGMVILNVITILITNKHFKLTTIMLIPYTCWLIFAGYLNGWIWLNN